MGSIPANRTTNLLGTLGSGPLTFSFERMFVPESCFRSLATLFDWSSIGGTTCGLARRPPFALG